MEKRGPVPETNGTISIVLLEDSALDAELALACLVKSGIAHTVQRVETREAFCAVLESECPDIILADFALPNFDGISALELAQERCPDTPFIFVSGTIGEDTAIESLKRGATDYVLKRRLERLGPAVRRALNECRQRTERQRAQIELARQARELAALNADLQQFVYAANHDLQAPLRTIAIFTELLGQEYREQLEDSGREYLHFVESAARHLSGLLEDLLSYTKIPAEQREMERVDLNEVFRRTMLLLQAAITESGAMITVEELPTVRGNRAQLCLVAQNVVSNALKYRSSEPPRIRIRSEREEDHSVVSVEDNGIGFEAVYGEQVFGLFKRLNRRDYAGSGLGLAMCRRIVELHGGRIWAESEVGHGAKVSFTLPVLGDA